MQLAPPPGGLTGHEDNMKNWLTALTIAFGGWLGLSGPAQAEVHDHARLFSAEKVTQANSMIKDIEQKYHRQIAVETFDSLPPEKANAIAGKNKTERNRTFRDWAHERVKATGARGVFILITKNPGHVEIVVDDATRNKEFTSADEQALVERLIGDFREK